MFSPKTPKQYFYTAFINNVNNKECNIYINVYNPTNNIIILKKEQIIGQAQGIIQINTISKVKSQKNIIEKEMLDKLINTA